MSEVVLRGVLPVFQTPYDSDGRPDLTVLRAEIRWMFSHGVDGVVMGMVSEVLRLSSNEIDLIGSAVCQICAEYSAPAVISVGAESTYVAVENAKRAVGYGATALMAIPPLATAAPDSEKLKYYRGILQAVQVPIIVQDASGYVGQPLSIAVQEELLREFPDRVLFKPEAAPIGPRVSALRDATGGRARIFEGTGGIALVDTYKRGVVGTMPGADLCWAIVQLWRALEANDELAIDEINGALVPLVAMQTSLDAFLAVEKHLLVLQEVFPNTLIRGPVSFEADPETLTEVERLFRRLKQAVAKHQRDSSIAVSDA
ncbi:MAG: dihydrodipicolinate synthase family protein [Actinomycetes bacterium]